MTGEITPEQMVVYRAAAQRRRRAKEKGVAARRARGWQVARRGAEILRQEFGVRHVVVFGSLLTAARFHERSDVDLAVWGLEDRAYYRAVAHLLDVDPAIPVDLVQVEHAQPPLLTVIEREGVAV